ncbi:hypothetical protein [Lactobacillus hominis]|uniref:Uncharacterized protein n=1 Tax=Lactobacillus hominis DSM 23910 = CRBIP 24.179 TaxID=1423758 RepID=I7L9R6_9LACO|nr:hypothetical protein [Lactobacillus hominis]MCT3348927.1 hypothetical protein [Lactobacillus hominis]CCI81619.1 Protein of unknown function [Lactobacillus hominis DSM 23910 = CRBIP 24.179]
MKMLFLDDSSCKEVYCINPDHEKEYIGKLIFDEDQNAWALWYWDNSTGDEGVTYTEDLEEDYKNYYAEQMQK